MLRTRIFIFNPLQTNCVVIWADGSPACTVVDPGMSSPEGLQELTDYFALHGLRPEAILLTHGHFDHIWGVEKLLALYDIPVYLHPADLHIMDQLTAGFRSIGPFNFLKHEFPAREVADGQVITTSSASWKVLHTPGHSPGSVCYWSADNNLLLSGDTLFAGSIGRSDLTGGDYDQLMASIKGKLLDLPGETDVIPGHGQPTTIAREGMFNPFLEPFNEPLDEA